MSDINGDGLMNLSTADMLGMGLAASLEHGLSGCGARRRWHIGKFNPPFRLTGVALTERSSFDAYEYDRRPEIASYLGPNAATWAAVNGDIDPAKPGYEFWAERRLG